MSKYGDEIKSFISNATVLVVEVPINVLVTLFKYYPEYYSGASVKPDKQKEFAELIAEHLHDEIDQETGASFIHNMLDAIFTEILEGNIYDNGTVDFEEDYYARGGQE